MPGSEGSGVLYSNLINTVEYWLRPPWMTLSQINHLVGQRGFNVLCLSVSTLLSNIALTFPYWVLSVPSSWTHWIESWKQRQGMQEMESYRLLFFDNSFSCRRFVCHIGSPIISWTSNSYPRCSVCIYILRHVTKKRLLHRYGSVRLDIFTSLISAISCWPV